MVKDDKYYASFNLADLASKTTKDKELRKRDKTWVLLLTCIAVRCIVSGESFETTAVLSYLGEPDRVKKLQERDMWEYDWYDNYGPTEYHSTTPFIVWNGIVVGLQGRDEGS